MLSRVSDNVPDTRLWRWRKRFTLNYRNLTGQLTSARADRFGLPRLWDDLSWLVSFWHLQYLHLISFATNDLSYALPLAACFTTYSVGTEVTNLWRGDKFDYMLGQRIFPSYIRNYQFRLNYDVHFCHIYVAFLPSFRLPHQSCGIISNV